MRENTDRREANVISADKTAYTYTALGGYIFLCAVGGNKCVRTSTAEGHRTKTAVVHRRRRRRPTASCRPERQTRLREGIVCTAKGPP